MKSKIDLNRRSHSVRSPYSPVIRSLIMIAVIISGLQVSVNAQEVQYTKPNWWFGAAGGANFNFYRGSTHSLNAELAPPAVFHDGNSVAPYAAALVEYHFPYSGLGIMLHVGYDGRSGEFNQALTACDCPVNLSTNLGYISVEPSLRYAPFNSGFYLFGGPRVAFNVSKSFDYKMEMLSSEAPQQSLGTVESKGDFSHIKNTLLSLQIGAGYDIPISSTNRKTQFAISPFVSFQPYFGQSPRSIETWNITTLRVGAALKFGVGTKIPPPPVVEVVERDYKVAFSVAAPTSVLSGRRVKEMFPLRNYVFFDRRSSDIPDRYVQLKANEAKEFNEAKVVESISKDPAKRSDRQMTVYYNVLNILGQRMQRDNDVRITLYGSSEKGAEEGLEMARSVKEYLVDAFQIREDRISIEGRDKPLVAPEKSVDTELKDLVIEGDRRVTIVNSASLSLKDFQGENDTILRPVEIVVEQEKPVDSYVSFYVNGADTSLNSWTLEVEDEKGNVQRNGPYVIERVSLPGKSILGDRPEGHYKVRMIGETKNGKTITEESDMHLTMWSPAHAENGLRYSVVFEFDESKLKPLYEEYLTKKVAPSIPAGSRIIIHGYTDIIGDDSHNQKLSLARAEDVRNILQQAVTQAGKQDVKFEVFGFGEDKNLSPFDNKYPEGRFHNRAVIIDIIPKE